MLIIECYELQGILWIECYEYKWLHIEITVYEFNFAMHWQEFVN